MFSLKYFGMQADHLSLQIALNAKTDEHAQLSKKLKNQVSMTDALEAEVGATREHLNSISVVIAKHEDLGELPLTIQQWTGTL
jgi:hypothetical protein